MRTSRNGRRGAVGARAPGAAVVCSGEATRAGSVRRSDPYDGAVVRARGAHLLEHAPPALVHIAQFRRLQGVWPRPWAPRTFSEHVLNRKLTVRDPLLTRTADKVAVREYVAGRGLGHLLVEATSVSSADEVVLEDLWPSFVAKAANGSGYPVIVADRDVVDEAELRRQVDALLKLSHYRVSREWAYKDIPHRVVLERHLTDGGLEPPDYKFFVVHGRPVLIQVDVARFVHHTRALMTPDWRLLDVRYEHDLPEQVPERPGSLPEMLDVACRLAEPFAFVRVDLYDLDGRIWFGELTHYPGGAREMFEPQSFDAELGAFFDDPDRQLDSSFLAAPSCDG